VNRVIIGLGSNIDPKQNIERAVECIDDAHRVLALSSLVETEPIGVTDQPKFLNGAVLIETRLTRDELNGWLRQLEADLGRVRTSRKYGPRTIDLDIVVWNGRIVHRDVRERDFLRRAVLEVAPDLVM